MRARRVCDKIKPNSDGRRATKQEKKRKRTALKWFEARKPTRTRRTTKTHLLHVLFWLKESLYDSAVDGDDDENGDDTKWNIMGHLLHQYFKNWLRINLLRKRHTMDESNRCACRIPHDHGITRHHISRSFFFSPPHISQSENGHKEYFVACLPSVDGEWCVCECVCVAFACSLSIVDVSFCCCIRDGKSILTVCTKHGDVVLLTFA